MPTPIRRPVSTVPVPETPHPSAGPQEDSTPVSQSQRRPRAKPRSIQEKVDTVLKVIQDMNMSLPAFLYYLFHVEDRRWEDVMKEGDYLDGYTLPHEDF